jgi:DNA (cytosine-5)-methyltransferase 3A
MIVLSLFDGISCARVALDRAGIKVNKYYASEVDKNAIKVSQKNYSDIVQLGDVREITTLPEPIDLLIGGSPCQDLSIAKKDRKGLEGDRSGLFWEYVRILRDIKPTWFILENVASMPKADRDIITREMGVEPVMINASLVSAQCRKRLFWTNIPNVTQPVDRGILLKDILQPDADVDPSMIVQKELHTTAQTGRNSTKKLGYVGDHDHQAKRFYDDEGKLPALNAVCNSLVKLGHIGNSDAQANRVYDSEGKSVTLSANGGGLGAKTGLYTTGTRIRKLTPIECERQVGIVPEATKQGYAIVHEGQSVDFSFPNSKTRRGRVGDKAKNLMTQSTIGVFTQGRIRKLTPIECERLQSLPDNYTEGVAKTHRYKCLGNAFNVEVVAHILNGLAGGSASGTV